MHSLLELLLPHLAVRDEEAQPGTQLLQLRRALLDRLDPIVEEERLPLASRFALECELHKLLVVLADGRADRAATFGRSLDDRDVAHAREREVERAGNRRRAEREHVDLEPQRFEELLLRDAEALLLVEDHEAELLRDHVAAEDPVRADQDVHLARAEVGQDPLRLLRRHETGDHLDLNRKIAKAIPEGVEMLLREDRRRREEQNLPPVHGHGERSAHRDLRLAEADVTADEPVHRPRRLEVLLHRLDRRLLIRRLAVREARLELRQPLAREVVRHPYLGLPLRIELDQVAGEVADRLACARLERLPRLAAELRQRGSRGVGADVARDFAELLVGDVEPVLAAEREQEIVPRDAGHGVRLEPEQLADAMVLVHDVVAGTKVGERLQRTAAEAPFTRRAPPEDLMVRQENEPEVTPDEAATSRRDGEEELGVLRQLVSRLEHPRLDPAEQVLRSQRLATVREGDDDPLARAEQRHELVLGLGEAARRDRGPLRFERKRLCLRERVELRRARERRRFDAVLLPHPAHVVRLKDEIGRAVERRDEVVGHLDDRPLTLVVRELGFDEIEAALCRGVQRGLCYRVKRPLGEGREGAHGLDLVAEELDAKGLAAGRREDVDDAAAHGELSSVVHALHPLVAGERKRLPQAFDTGLETRAQLDRLGPHLRGRQPLGQRSRRRADEPASLEHVESSCPLADEVRRRQEPRLPGDAATRQQSDRVVAEEPGRALGSVARIRVLRKEDYNRTSEPLVQRGEQEW